MTHYTHMRSCNHLFPATHINKYENALFYGGHNKSLGLIMSAKERPGSRKFEIGCSSVTVQCFVSSACCLQLSFKKIDDMYNLTFGKCTTHPRC